MSGLKSEKYSISPNSGKLRKKIKKKSTDGNGLFKKRLDNFDYNAKTVFVLVLVAVVASLFITFKYIQSNKGADMPKTTNVQQQVY